MQPSAHPETADSDTSIDPTLMVSMFDDHLVICVPSRLDLETTEVLVVAASSAVASGSTVMIDLDPSTASHELAERRPLSSVAANCVNGGRGAVDVLAPGYVRLATREAHWTFDLSHGRLCRSDDVIEPQFVGPEAWTPIRAVWVTTTNVTALASDGTYLSTRTAWTTGDHPSRRANSASPRSEVVGVLV